MIKEKPIYGKEYSLVTGNAYFLNGFYFGHNSSEYLFVKVDNLVSEETRKLCPDYPKSNLTLYSAPSIEMEHHSYREKGILKERSVGFRVYIKEEKLSKIEEMYIIKKLNIDSRLIKN